MHNNSIHRLSIIRLVVLTLLALCFVQPLSRAQEPERKTAALEPDENELTCNFRTAAGMARGQTARFTFVNPQTPLLTEPGQALSFVQVMLLDCPGSFTG